MSFLRLKLAASVLIGFVSFFTQISFANEFIPDLSPTRDVLITTPNDGLQTEIANIQKAQSEIVMTMYHLTEAKAVQALADAVARKVNVRIIVDGKSQLKPGSNKNSFDKLKSLGVDIRPSSPAFSLTHSKTMVIDKKVAFVSSLNFTSLNTYGRDFGIYTQDKVVISDVLNVFEADWKNAAENSMKTPAFNSARLIFSPINSADVLIQFIDTAQSKLILYAENLGSKEIVKSLVAAAKRKVSVKVIVPLCDLNPGDPFYNIKVKDELLAAGVQFKVMPGRGSAQVPYIHAKMILVDDKKAYVGSVNFSMNSLHFARETGIFVEQDDILKSLDTTFNQDWAITTDVPAQLDPALCLSPGGTQPSKPAEETAPTDLLTPPQNLLNPPKDLLTNVSYISSRGSASGFCQGGGTSYFCIDNLKRRAQDDAANDARLQCSVRSGTLQPYSGSCSDFCSPFSVPEGRNEFVTCSSNCTFRCELP